MCTPTRKRWNCGGRSGEPQGTYEEEHLTVDGLRMIALFLEQECGVTASLREIREWGMRPVDPLPLRRIIREHRLMHFAETSEIMAWVAREFGESEVGT